MNSGEVMTHRVLSVGQCGMDHGSISRFLGQHFDVSIEEADGASQALDKLRDGSFSLVLVNRVFDRDGGEGLSLIREVRQSEATGDVPIMLVSNYPDSQQQAVALGAAPGFGKSELHASNLADRFASFLGTDS